jgi:hypothetical protein
MSLPHLANIESLERYDQQPHNVAVTVRGGGRKRRLGVRLPFVMSVARGSAGPEPALPARDGTPSIETLAVFDPEVTVIRRRTEMLGTSTQANREPRQVTSAAELVAALRRTAT